MNENPNSYSRSETDAEHRRHDRPDRSPRAGQCCSRASASLAMKPGTSVGSAPPGQETDDAQKEGARARGPLQGLRLAQGSTARCARLRLPRDRRPLRLTTSTTDDPRTLSLRITLSWQERQKGSVQNSFRAPKKRQGLRLIRGQSLSMTVDAHPT